MPDVDKMINDLCRLEEGLSRWEVDFVDSLARQRQDDPDRKLTFNQVNKLEELWEKHC